MSLLVSLILINSPAQASWLSRFCERHLIADDPHQYDQLTVDQLVTTYLQHGSSTTLTRAVRARLQTNLTHEEREALKVTGVQL